MKGKLLLLTCTILATLLISVAINSANVLAITGTIGNARMVLYPTVGSVTGASIPRTILVRNVNNESIHIQAVAPTENPNKIDIANKDFTLAPDEARNISITIHVANAGDFEDKVNIFFSPIDTKGAGVVLSSVIIIHATKKGWFGSADGGNTGNQVNDTTVNNNNNNTNMNLGNSTAVGSGNGSGMGSGIIILGLSTIILMVILILILVIFMKRKKKPKLIKRSVRSS